MLSIFTHAKGEPTMGYLNKASGTVLTAGTFCSLTAGLAVVATASSPKLAYVLADAPAGTTKVHVVSDLDTIYAIPTQTALVAANLDTEIDLVSVSGELVADPGASTTDVLKVVANNATLDDGRILVKINKPIALR